MSWAHFGRNIPDPVRWLVVFIAVAAIGFTGYNWYQQSRTRVTAQGPNQLYHARCPACGTETPYARNLVKTRARCAKCGREWVFPDPTRESSSFFFLPGVMIGVVAVLMSVWLFLTRATRVRENLFYTLNCPGCGRKLRFHGSQAGKSGSCPRCERACVFPTRAEPAEFGG